MRDDSPVAALVARARHGDKQAWDAIVDRYAPLIWSICRRYRLDRADADDVGQSVWLRLVDQLALIREPGRPPGLAGHDHPPGMRPGAQRGPAAGGAGRCGGRGGRPGR